MMFPWQLVTVLVLALLSSSTLKAINYHPIAASRLDHGSVFILTDEGTVLAVNVGSESAVVVGMFDLDVRGAATDMCLSNAGGQYRLYVASTSSPGNTFQGWIQEFSTDGKIGRSWPSRRGVSGLACSREDSLLYLSTSDDSAIYAIDLSKLKTDSKYVSDLSGYKIGAIAVSQTTLYAADVDKGVVVSKVRNGRSTSIVAKAARPQALLLSPDQHTLYIADAGRGQIIKVVTDNAKPATQVALPASSMRAPIGLAMGDDDRIVVVDQQLGQLFVLDANGKLLITKDLERKPRKITIAR